MPIATSDSGRPPRAWKTRNKIPADVPPCVDTASVRAPSGDHLSFSEPVTERTTSERTTGTWHANSQEARRVQFSPASDTFTMVGQWPPRAADGEAAAPTRVRSHPDEMRAVPDADAPTAERPRVGAGCAPADLVLHVQVVKELLGREVRDIVRSELRTALMAEAPALHHSPFSGRLSADTQGDESRAATPSASKEKPRPSTVTEEIRLKRIKSLAAQSRERHPFEEPGLAELVSVLLPSGLREGVRNVSGWSARLGETAPEDVGGRLRYILETKEVEFLVAVVITCNCLFTVFYVDYEAAHIGERVPVSYTLAEAGFFLFYLLEIILKLSCYRAYYFFGEDWQFNWMDLVQVIGGGFSLADSISSHGGAINVQWLRSLRIFRMLRILRVLRVVQRFKTLRCILKSIAGSMPTLTWSMVMLLVFIYGFSMYFVQRTANFFVDGADVEDHAQLRDQFGSVYTSMETLFVVATGGMDWIEAYNNLRPVGWFSCMVFVFHIILIQCSLVNIVTAMFVEQAMKRMSGDNHQKALEHSMLEMQLGKEFRQLCLELSKDYCDRISHAEWEDFFSKPTSHSYLEMLGLRSHDVLEYFKALSHTSDDGTVDIDEFVSGCLRMKGTASCFETQALLAEIRSIKQIMLDSQRQIKSQSITRQRARSSPRF